MLRKYDTIIIDEAHERSLNIDFLLGYLKRLLPRRPDLKLIITSATIDPERFARHFADRRGTPAPIIEVSGRTYPVEVRYRPLLELPEEDEEGEAVVRDQTEAIVDAVKELLGRGARRHPGVPARRAGDPRHRRRALRPDHVDPRRRPRDRAALLAALGRRAAPGLRSRTPAAGSCSPPTSPRPR